MGPGWTTGGITTTGGSSGTGAGGGFGFVPGFGAVLGGSGVPGANNGCFLGGQLSGFVSGKALGGQV